MLKDKFVISPNGGELFVDHSKKDRSGHLGHALVEYQPGKVLAFYPDCSSEDNFWNGHSGHGWMKYKRSLDGGVTWEEAKDEPNSKRHFEEYNGQRSLMCEKAVVTDSGRIVLFYLQCDLQINGHIWEPYYQPFFAISDDKGETFSNLKTFTEEPGRIWDALYYKGNIYLLFQQGDGRIEQTNSPYFLYVSNDNGESFSLLSQLPFGYHRGILYGTMVFTPENKLMVYTYDLYDEHNAKYIVSEDFGKTWATNRRCFFENRIRNPQITYFNQRYLLHGRSGMQSGHFIIYSSKDGIHWDQGQYLLMRTAGTGAYSNNVIVHSENGEERLLIQTSHAYEKDKTNLIHFFVTAK